MSAAQLVASVALAALAVLPPAARADTIKVKAGAGSIQDAVDAAGPGDTIVVGKGLYVEQVELATEGLVLIGKGAVIDAEYAGDGIRVTADGVTVSGFTILNGLVGLHADDGDDGVHDLTVEKLDVRASAGAGILVIGDAAHLSRNVVCGAGDAGIVYRALAFGSETLIERNRVERSRGAGLDVVAANVRLDRNRATANAGDGLLLDVNLFFPDGGPGDGGSPRPFLSRNRLERNGGSGLSVTDPIGTGTEVRKNTLRGNTGAGLAAVGVELLIEGNRAEQNIGPGFDLATSFSRIDGNRALDNGLQGFAVAQTEADGPPLGSNDLLDNLARGNARDGILLTGVDQDARDNTCLRNLGDGIDIEGGFSGHDLDGNTALHNQHEGIDNGGDGTALRTNVARKNGAGLGPDIAGTGDEGTGTVGSFSNNIADTGGDTTPARLDHPGDG